MFDCQVLNTPFDAIFLSVAQAASFTSINNSPPLTTQQDENNNNSPFLKPKNGFIR